MGDNPRAERAVDGSACNRSVWSVEMISLLWRGGDFWTNWR